MQRIASFCVDHTKLKKGLYLSRVDTDVTTYDVRMCLPNSGTYLSNGAMHTFEHLFATYARNSALSQGVIYVGPMGCRTGFYFLTRGLSHSQVITLLRECFVFLRDFSGEIPGATEVECGNYREHDLAGAKEAAVDMLAVLEHWTPELTDYEYAANHL